MRWMLTSCGHEVDLEYPKAGVIVLADIANALAKINRFNGHTCRPYSVAEHSLLVLEIVEREFRLDVHGRFAALMHDAHEAYTSDVPSPHKHVIGDGWHHLERRFERMVRSCFALHTAAYAHAEAIRQADLIALATERVQLMPPGGSLWEVLVHVQPAGWADLMEPGRCSLTWADWRQAFHDKAQELEYERGLRVNAIPTASEEVR